MRHSVLDIRPVGGRMSVIFESSNGMQVIPVDELSYMRVVQTDEGYETLTEFQWARKTPTETQEGK